MPARKSAGPNGFVRLRRLADGSPVYDFQYRPHGGTHEKPKQKVLGPAHLGRGRPPAGTYTRAQAEIELEKFLQRLADEPPPTEELYFEVVVDGYLAWCVERARRPLVEDTMRTYRQIANELKAVKLARDRTRTWGNATMDELDDVELEAYVRALENRKLAPSTLNQRRAVVMGIWKFAKKRMKVRDLAAVEDCWEFTPVPDSEDYDVYTREQIWAVARAMQSLQDAAMVLLAAFCGLRQSELRGLRWRAIGWTESFIYVARKHTAAAVADGLPKGKKVYSVPLPDQVAAVLDELSKRGHHDADDDRVFVGDAKGGTVDAPALRRRWKAAQLRAGLNLDLRLHDLRHTFGTIAVEEWEDIEKVREFMGHKDIKTTRRYLHRKPKTADAARMTAAIGGELDLGAIIAKPQVARRRGAEGVRNKHAKLTEDDVRTIRARLAEGVTQKDLAAEYGVATSTMAYIATGRTWAHLLPEAPAEAVESPVASEEKLA